MKWAGGRSVAHVPPGQKVYKKFTILLLTNQNFYGIIYSQRKKEMRNLKMYTLTYIDSSNHSHTVDVIDKEYATLLLNKVIHAIDCHYVILLNGFSGEVLEEWKNGHMIYPTK